MQFASLFKIAYQAIFFFHFGWRVCVCECIGAPYFFLFVCFSWSHAIFKMICIHSFLKYYNIKKFSLQKKDSNNNNNNKDLVQLVKYKYIIFIVQNFISFRENIVV